MRGLGFLIVFLSAVVSAHVNVVLLGATGDLARKYLWQAFFSLTFTQPETDFYFFAGARDDETKGWGKVEGFLDTRLLCPADLSDTACMEQKFAFKQRVTYMQLKKPEHYERLATLLDAVGPAEEEEGRIFYLSVPPFAYKSISESVVGHCRPSSGAWFRVVLEKPFGRDVASAKQLAADVAAFYEEHELYRIDHYLGKTGAAAISDFRSGNPSYTPLWNRHHVERVDIVMKEQTDCAGRTQFYDHYGVVRDVLQNHLTELMVLIAMEELPPQSASLQGPALATLITALKHEVLSAVRPVHSGGIVTGQYEGYAKHVQEDDESKTSTGTPTFASAVLQINSERWQGVPFVLTAGKMLDTREAYVRVRFKRDRFCSTHSDLADADIRCSAERDLIFSIQGPLGTAVLRSKSLPFVAPNPLLDPLPDAQSAKWQGGVFKHSADAYTELVRGVFLGHRHRFVDANNLMLSWGIWDAVVSPVSSPRLYSASSPSTWLDTELAAGGNLQFSEPDPLPLEAEDQEEEYEEVFRNQPLMTAHTFQLAGKLAHSILHAAQEAIKEKGVFHLALSGGSSPHPLFHHLAFASPTFPWTHTHVWQVDERCGSADTRNFLDLEKRLLRHVNLLRDQVHPLPVQGRFGLCDSADSPAASYEAEIRRHIPDGKFDFIVLGLGVDGHTASLFPGAPLIDEDLWVAQVAGPVQGTAGASPSVPRLTLSGTTIAQAGQIAVLATGAAKLDLLFFLQNPPCLPETYPICGIEGNVHWFMDYAILGFEDGEVP